MDGGTGIPFPHFLKGGRRAVFKIVLPPCQTVVSACVSVPLGPSCRACCQCVQQNFTICGFSRLRCCYVYHTGLRAYKIPGGHGLVAGFGIAVRYIDCTGRKKSRFYESSVVFRDSTGKFDSADCDVRFTDFVCHIDGNGTVNAAFTAELRSRRDAPDQLRVWPQAPCPGRGCDKAPI